MIAQKSNFFNLFAFLSTVDILNGVQALGLSIRVCRWTFHRLSERTQEGLEARSLSRTIDE